MGDNTYPELTLETWMYRLCGVGYRNVLPKASKLTASVL